MKRGMISLATKMTPNTPFLVVADEVFENATEILNSLYGPIVGTSALGLYFQLKNLIIFQEQPNQIHTHFELQSLLNVSINQLETDRKMLEACGLLKTWLVNSKNQVMYLVRRPLSAKEFFATDLLTILLLEKLGDQVFQQVQNRMVPKQNIPEEAEEVTASVTDTFPLIVERMKRNQAQLTQVKNQLGDFKVGPQNTNQERPLDEKLLLSILENSFVELDSVKLAMEVIQTESALYGIDEVQMGKYVLKAVNLQTNRLDVKKLKTVISNDFRAPVRGTLEGASSETTPAVNPQSNLSAQQLQITKFAGQMAPLQFLQQIKKQKRGFVTSGEERLVRDLIGRHILSNSVINILIYHLLVDEQHATLNKSLSETIANDWSQQKIATAEQAISKLQERKQKATAKPVRSRNNNGRKSIKETLPEWAKTTASAKNTTKLTPEQEKKLQERLNKLKK
ncbi:DnaD domain protein [Lentilactobacillus senioris]|uniref:DnaD domain protein n=1 Tax=Lentilactobacillus senioris TaxID=931534 RepID=UPI002280754D|nr:DnaD domain protein [Lentilactobacillus senioris]MCY9806960.1 DnaD domain protein [Lentilactobacillus senioris]